MLVSLPSDYKVTILLLPFLCISTHLDALFRLIRLLRASLSHSVRDLNSLLDIGLLLVIRDFRLSTAEIYARLNCLSDTCRSLWILSQILLQILLFPGYLELHNFVGNILFAGLPCLF